MKDKIISSIGGTVKLTYKIGKLKLIQDAYLLSFSRNVLRFIPEDTDFIQRINIKNILDIN